MLERRIDLIAIRARTLYARDALLTAGVLFGATAALVLRLLVH